MKSETLAVRNLLRDLGNRKNHPIYPLHQVHHAPQTPEGLRRGAGHDIPRWRRGLVIGAVGGELFRVSEDPYQPPKTAGESEGPLFQKHALIDIVKGWEKLRVAYNLILLLPGIAILVLWIDRQRLPVSVLVVEAILVAIAANLAFLLGPAAEMYFRALFRRGESIGFGRMLIFGAGLVVSAGVFLMAFLLGMA